MPARGPCSGAPAISSLRLEGVQTAALLAISQLSRRTPLCMELQHEALHEHEEACRPSAILHCISGQAPLTGSR